MRATLVRDVRCFMWWTHDTCTDRQSQARGNRDGRGVCRKVGDEEAAGDFMSPTASVGVLWRCPTLPQPVGCSTIGAAGLSFQVRNGCWAFPRCYDHHKCWCSTLSPTLFCVVGVWVDRGLYSGCGCCAGVSCSPERCVGLLFSVGPLVPVGSRAHCCASTSGLSTR